MEGDRGILFVKGIDRTKASADDHSEQREKISYHLCSEPGTEQGNALIFAVLPDSGHREAIEKSAFTEAKMR
jgi:hypothetical protein